MSKLGMKLRSLSGGWAHRCPGCKSMHQIPNTWSFNGDPESPSFSPSLIQGTQCHYHITNGKIIFCADCTHDLAGQTVDLPDLE